MKKTLFIIIGVFAIIVLFLTFALINAKSANQGLRRINREYESFLNKNIYGTELATLINKSMEYNKEKHVEKDKDGFFKENNINSIKIYIKMKDSKNTYQMEKIFALGTEQFVELFNISMFRCEDLSYHNETGQIAKMVFKQISD